MRSARNFVSGRERRGSGRTSVFRVIASLLMLLGLLGQSVALTPSVAAASIDLVPVADTTVYQSMPNTSFGTKTTLEVDASPVKVVYLRFDIPNFSNPVTKATLTLHVTDSSSKGGDLSLVSSTSWSETTTWNTRPPIDGAKLASIAAVKSGTNIQVDVSSGITGAGLVTFALTSSSSDGADYGSRESVNPPKLTIQTDDGANAPPPVDATVNPTADATVAKSQPATSFGTQSTLLVDNSPVKVVYLRFDVPQYDGTLSHATLTLHVADSSNRGGDIFTVSNTTWAESITWNSRPAIDGALVSSLPAVRSGSNVSIDVTDAVKGPGPLSLAITTSSSDGADYASRETATPPQLTIESIPPPPLPSLTLPVRAAFYYPWFPGAWNQQGYNPFTRYQPTLGYYDSGDAATINQHVVWMQQAHLQAAIASWWGQGTTTDINFHKDLQANNNGFKWSIYYEPEGIGNPTQDQIRSDLSYLRDTAFNDPDYLRINGKPVVFVYNTDDTTAEVAQRWVPVAQEFNVYLSLKVFAGYRTITPQPDSWHQYAPSSRLDHQAGFSTTISPGFWRIDEATPRLARDETAYAAAVAQMATNNDPWQLVTTFNEWGEGTSIEPSTDWGMDYINLTAGGTASAPAFNAAMALAGQTAARSTASSLAANVAAGLAEQRLSATAMVTARLAMRDDGPGQSRADSQGAALTSGNALADGASGPDTG